MKPKGLGRGLEAIFSSEKIEAKRSVIPTEAHGATATTVAEIPLGKITPNTSQPRRDFSQEELEHLSESIKELGIIQPITIKSNGGDNYTIISGERRWRAARMAGLTTIPAYLREVDDVQLHLMALVENLQREDLNPIEVAQALQRLIDECGLTQEALAQRVSMKRSTVSNFLRLNRLSDEIQYALKHNLITMGHAKAIASVEAEEARGELLQICIERGISVREVEALAQKINEASGESESKKPVAVSVPKGMEGLSKHLHGIFPKGVSFKTNSRGGGKITINYSSQSELMQLIEELDIR